MRPISRVVFFVVVAACKRSSEAQADAATDVDGSTSTIDAGITDDLGVGAGRDGDLAIGAGETKTINAYTPLSVDREAGDTGVVVEQNPGIDANDVVLVWQTTGATSATSGKPESVRLALGVVGAYQLARVVRVNGQLITLDAPLTRAYRAAGAQVVRVPQYTSVRVAEGGAITAAPWDGRRGGVVALLVKGSLEIDGALGASKAGFRGGRGHKPAEARAACVDALDGTSEQGFGAKGEGFFMTSYSPSGGGDAIGGRGNVLNGGGGGNCQKAGGAGGGNGSRGGPGGQGTFEVEPASVGGLGGAEVVASLRERLVMGGGGGAGDQQTSDSPTSGGTGGGVVFVRAEKLSGKGTITADGESAAKVGDDGASGGGAGGSVFVRVTGSITSCRVSTRGGNGGSAGADTGARGPGGGGGGGHVLLLPNAGPTCPIEVASGVAGSQPYVDAGVTPTSGAGPITPENGIIEP